MSSTAEVPTRQVPSSRQTVALMVLSGLVAMACILVSVVRGLELGPLASTDMTRSLLSSIEKHKDLFPLDSWDTVGTILISLGLFIAASGGIGGGGMIVPLLILIFGFHPKYAIPLSNFTIVGSSITNMYMNLSKRHPDANRPLVDWDLILVMEPLTMAGAIVGAFLSKILPDWILTVSLVILLAYTTYTTLLKGMKDWAAETKKFEEEKRSLLMQAHGAEIELQKKAESVGLLSAEGREEEEEEEEAIRSSNRAEKGNALGGGAIEIGASATSESALTPMDPELAALIKKEEETPMDKVYILSFMVVAVIVLNLLKGGGSTFPSPVGIVCGTTAYWGVTVLVLALVIFISLWMRSELIERWKLKKRLRYVYVKGDVEWNETNTIIYPCACFFAGFFAGMFGVGGGIVKGPLMLQMGVDTRVASATCAVMIMFTSVAATAMFVAFGTLTWDYAIFLFVIGLFTTAVGQVVVADLVKKTNRVSLISLSIGAVVAISTVLMAIQSIFSLIDAQQNGSKTSGVCE